MGRGGFWGGSDVVLLILIGLARLPQYAVACVRTASALRGPESAAAWPRVEGLLAVLLAAWTLVPVLARGVDPNGPGISPGRMKRFPLPHFRLLLLGPESTLVHPVYWMLLIASAFAILPLLAGGRPVMGLLTGLLYVTLCVLSPWAVWTTAVVVFTLPRRWLFLVIGLAVAALTVTLVDLGRLVSSQGAEALKPLLGRFLAILPGGWAVRAVRSDAGAVWLLPLAGLGALALVSAAACMTRLIHHPEGSQGGKLRRLSGLTGWPGIRGARSVLVAKEMLFLSRTFDLWIGLAISVAATIYLIAVPHPELWPALAGLFAIGINMQGFSLNSFGLDRGGVDRYRMSPLVGKEILLTKNLALFVVSFGTMAPVVLAALLRFGPAFAAAAVTGAAGSLLLSAAWGNVISVERPSPRNFFGMESEQSGGIVGSVGSLVIWLVPLLIALASFRAGTATVFLLNSIYAALAWLPYRSAQGWAGQVFDRNSEVMRSRLSE